MPKFTLVGYLPSTKRDQENHVVDMDYPMTRADAIIINIMKQGPKKKTPSNNLKIKMILLLKVGKIFGIDVC